MEANQNGAGDSIPSSQSSEPNATGGNKPKIRVIVDMTGRVVGDNAKKFATRAGELIRVHCPLSYADWRLIPKNFKDDVWNALMFKFDFNVPSEVARPLVELSFPQKFRSHKYGLRKTVLKGLEGQEAAELACPDGYNPNNWKAFVAREAQAKVKERRAQNVESRLKNTICHTLGRRSYANKNYMLEKKEGIVIEEREDSWLKGHEKIDGTVHPSALEKYEEVKAAIERRKNTNGEGSNSQLDFDTDVLAEVFGPDVGKGNLRAYSSHVSKKRAQQAMLASSLIEDRVEKDSAPLKGEVKKMASKLEQLSSVVETVVQRFHIQGMTEVTAEDGAPALNIGSSSVRRTLGMNMNPSSNGAVRNDINDSSRVSTNSYVNLLSRDGRIVATGYIVTGKDGEVCHGRKVLPGEKKIRIEEVQDISAPIPDAPQGDGHFTLAGFVEGGWLIWIESRLQQLS